MLKHYMANMADQVEATGVGERDRTRQEPGTGAGKTFQLTRRWEYRRLDRDIADPVLPVEDLEALGVDGWELAGVVSDRAGAHYFLKRLRGG